MRLIAYIFAAGMLAGLPALLAQPADQETDVEQTPDAPAAPDTPAAPSAAPQEPSAFAERYGVLSQTNIFLRQRRPAAPTARATVPAPHSPEQLVVLRGIVFESNSFRAYFENRQGGSAIRVSPGERIARGHIQQILIDAIAYEAEDQVVWIEIGQDLTGRTPSEDRPAASATAEDEDATLTPADELQNADPSTLTLEQRMRLRRMQEMNRQQGRRP